MGRNYPSEVMAAQDVEVAHSIFSHNISLLNMFEQEYHVLSDVIYSYGQAPPFPAASTGRQRW